MQCGLKLKTSEMEKILQCFGGSEGKELLHEEGVIQNQQDPHPKYVPWILLNDVSHLYKNAVLISPT